MVKGRRACGSGVNRRNVAVADVDNVSLAKKHTLWKIGDFWDICLALKQKTHERHVYVGAIWVW